jgi:hypothetical protein
MVEPIHVLTPDGDSADFAVSWQPEFARISAALGAAGLDAVAHPLSTPLPPGAEALALLAWGYHLAPDQWARRLERWEAQGVRLHNPVRTLRWNWRKTYLCELADAGAPVVPTLAAEVVTPATLAEARQRFGCTTLVVKPQVGACAHGAFVVEGDEVPPLAEPAIVQPFLASIRDAGELSLIYLGGRFSHAVRKVPAAGDFRVQEEHGGVTVPFDPPAEARVAAEAALALAPARCSTPASTSCAMTPGGPA